MKAHLDRDSRISGRNLCASLSNDSLSNRLSGAINSRANVESGLARFQSESRDYVVDRNGKCKEYGWCFSGRLLRDSRDF